MERVIEKWYFSEKVLKPTVDTTVINITNNYYYSNDTIICNCEHNQVKITDIDTAITMPIFPVDQDDKRRKWSVFLASGIAAHDIKSDKYTDPYYKFSPTVHGGITYNIDKQFRVSLVGDYTYPAQFLYNAQYLGIGGLAEYDCIRNGRSHLNIGTGLDYSHSYNKRTFKNEDNGNTNSFLLKTDNLYIPCVINYEFDIKNFAIGAYLRYRHNIKGSDLSNRYFFDGGIQARYKF